MGYRDSHGLVGFGLPHEKKALGNILKILEGLKGEEECASSAGRRSAKVLQDYTINGPTLEEVFMNVARDNEAVCGV